MVEQGIQPSRDNLIDFLNFVAEKGLMKSSTAVSYKKACVAVLKILDEVEVADLSKINLEAVFQRHRNLAAGRLPPATLKTYEVRTRAAINAFIEYIKDPSSWKPSIKTRTPRTERTASSKKIIRRERASKPEEVIEEEDKSKQPSVHIDFQIHISPEANPEQIAKIFASMREHLYPKQND